jgi:hypothetical protein
LTDAETGGSPRLTGEPEEPVELRAGPVVALLDGSDLRRIRVGDVELAQRIYPAVRDATWNTIPGELVERRIDQGSESFGVTLRLRHRFGDLDFYWDGRIEGDATGALTYAFDGVAATRFRYAKIGFNIHHGLDQYVGRPYVARTPSGPVRGELPVEIIPQLMVDGRLTALFPEYDELVVSLRDGIEVTFRFEGDLFEMQDHRNWTDANFKTYGTPMSEPWPFDALSGQRIRQRVTVGFEAATLPVASARDRVVLTLDRTRTSPLPPIGFGASSVVEHLTGREVELLRAAGPAHIRVDLELVDGDPEAALGRGRAQADALDVPIELAVFVPTEGSDAALERLAALLAADLPRVCRLLVFAGGSAFSGTAGSTPAWVMHAARSSLSSLLPGVPLLGGTNQFFAELNRSRPATEAMEGIVFSLNPQVHAGDDLSIVENLAAQADVVEMTRSFAGGLPIVVSPVTFVGRNGPFPGGPADPDGLPGQVDARQTSLLGAGWVVGSVKYLAESGVASTTFFETVGWLGLLESETGPPRPDLFPSSPGDVFPLWQVFADLAEWSGGSVVACGSSDPLDVLALAVQTQAGLHLLLANLTPRGRKVDLTAVGRPSALRMLDDRAAVGAAADPTGFRAAVTPCAATELVLPRRAFARLDFTT